jgi:hypothetical protein
VNTVQVALLVLNIFVVYRFVRAQQPSARRPISMRVPIAPCLSHTSAHFAAMRLHRRCRLGTVGYYSGTTEPRFGAETGWAGV